MIFLKLFFLFCISSFAFAKPIIVGDKIESLEILSLSSIYLDKTKSLSIKDIQNKDKEFKQNTQKRLSFGYSPDYDVWIKLTFKNNTNKTLRKIIEYANPLTTHLEFFDPSINSSFKDGFFQINPKRKTTNPFFDIELQPLETKTYYLKASSSITTMIVNLQLWDSQEFFNQELKHQSILQLFFGAMLVLMIYNFFVYLFTKDISYFYYVLYLIGIIFHQIMYTGMAYLYIINQEQIYLLINYAVFIVAFPIFALSLFTIKFIKLNQYLLLNKLLLIYLFLFPFLTYIFIVFNDFSKYRNIFTALLLIILVIITFYAAFKRNRQAYFIVGGWFIILIGGLSMYFSSIGYLDINYSFKYIVELSFVSEALLFSIALADKINHLQIERDSINQALIVQKETEKERLEIEVKRKTKELQVAVHKQTTLLKELNHRVKNNMQTIISLVQLQADEIDDDDIVDIFMTIQNRISAMTHLHELLYKQSDITHINTHEYFDILVDALQSSYEVDVNITYDVKLNLEVEPAISCGLILNELIINSFKYAFDETEDGTIHIELYKEDEAFHFNICDNGKGYDLSATKNSFGLVLVSTLVEDHLRGTIITSTSKGVSNKISWSEDE
jgi:two-component sensor histidine kinase